MRIEVISVSSLAEGAEILLTVKLIDEESGNYEKKKLSLFTEKYLELGLRRGSVIDVNTFDELERISEACRAIKKGSDLLSYAASSKKQLAQKLKRRGFDGARAEEAVDYLESAGMIDERENVRAAVSLSLKKLWGRKRIYCELIKKGYDRSCVSEEVDIIDFEEFVENCKRLIAKRVNDIPSDPVELKKLINFLARYGYSFSEIKAALSALNRDS